MEKLTNEEKILNVLIEKCNTSKTNEIYVYKSDFDSLDVTEKDITRTISIFQTEGLFNIVKKSPQDDLSIPWILSFTLKGISYFKNQNQKSTSSKREWVRTYVPVTISFVALVKSFLPEIISLLKSIMQVLK